MNNENKENKTELFIKEIKNKAVSYDGKQLKKLDKKFNLKIPTEKLNKNIFTNINVLKTIICNDITKENSYNSCVLTLSNSYVMKCISDIYDIDVNKVKMALVSGSEIYGFNSLVSSELKNNSEIFLKPLL